MFEVLKDDIRRKVPAPIKLVLLSWYRNTLQHLYFLALFAFVILCWFGWALFGKTFVNWAVGDAEKPFENAGQLGDSFGILNTLFAGIAALGATMVYFKQSEQLRNDKAAAEKQQFENTFFQLLNVFHGILNSTRYNTTETINRPDGEGPIFREIHGQGREGFQLLARDFEDPLFNGWLRKCDEIKNEGKKATIQYRFDFLEKRYQGFFAQHSPQLSHYFRTLYRLLSIVHNSPVSNKRSYGKIVRAQLSDHELMFLFYNGNSCMGEKMNKFVYEFALLKHLPKWGGFPGPETRKFYGDANSPAYNDTPDGADVKAPDIPYDPAALTSPKLYS